MMFPHPESYQIALKLSENLPPTPKNILKVADKTNSEASRWAFSQWKHRSTAREKFPEAHKLLFTAHGLEMATSHTIALYHSTLFPEDAPVVDLTTGIGGDLIALARRGPTTGHDIDSLHASYATYNAHILGLDAPVSPTPAESALSRTPPHLLLDPARRTSTTRLRNPDDFSPPLSLVRQAIAQAETAVIKLSPLLDDDLLESFRTDLIFVGSEDQCPEALLVSGPPRRRAVLARAGLTLDSKSVSHTVTEIATYLYEAHPAAIRAHCLGQFRHPALAKTNGYLTSDTFELNPWLTPFKILWHGPYREATLLQTAKSLDIQPTVCKTREAPIDPRDALKPFRKLQGKSCILFIVRINEKLHAAFADRAPMPPS